jgi:arabinogalactan oligomer/maltooligosaccharide transport system substrate-binding protein
VRLVVLGLLAALLVACGTGGAGTTQTPGAAAPGATAAPGGAVSNAVSCPRPLTFWPALGSDELDFAREQAQAFQQRTGVAVNILDVPFDQLQQQFIQATPAGQGPDLLYGPNDWIGVLAEGGFLADLTGRFDTTRYLTNTIQAVTYNDRIWGVPEAFEVVAQYRNTEILPQPPTNLADLQTAQVPAGQFALAFDITNFYYAAPFLYAVGGNLFDNEGNFVLTEEAATTWLTTMRDLQQQGNLPREATGEAAKALFMGGNSGSFYSGPWDVTDVRAADVEWEITPLPQVNGQDARPFLGTKAMYVSSQSPCQDAALAFIEQFTSTETGLAWIQNANPAHLPANTAVYEDAAIADNQAIQGFRAQAERATPLPNLAAMGQVWTPGETALTSVLNGGTDPAAAARDMVTTIRNNIQAQQ